MFSNQKKINQKRTKLSKIQGKEICLYANQYKNATHEQITAYFNQKYQWSLHRSTVTKILSKRQTYLAIEEYNISGKIFRFRKVKFPQLNEALSIYISQVISKGLFITDLIIKEKARSFAKILGISETDIKFSNGWLDRFKAHNNLRKHYIHGEAKSAPIESLPHERKYLKHKLRKYSPDDIFNADETGLFFRMTPNQTLSSHAVTGTKKVI
jgi:Tc5 transposase DNA-binding domain/Fission yeast centromere protein N-terminal domain